VPRKSIPAHGRASVFLTAIGGGLAIGVISRSGSILGYILQPWVESSGQRERSEGIGLHDWDVFQC